MDFPMELLAHMLAQRNANIEVTFPDLDLSIPEIVESAACRALREIHRILWDDSLTDYECFQKIEQIVSVFEDLSSDGGSRHDFG